VYFVYLQGCLFKAGKTSVKSTFVGGSHFSPLCKREDSWLKLLEGGRRRRRKENSITLKETFCFDGSSMQLLHDCCTIPLVYGAAQPSAHFIIALLVSVSFLTSQFLFSDKVCLFWPEIFRENNFLVQIQLLLLTFWTKKKKHFIFGQQHRIFLIYKI